MIVFDIFFFQKRPKSKQEKFAVDHIHNKRAMNGILEYEIYWYGYEEPTWEPQKIIQIDCPQLRTQYARFDAIIK